MRHALCSSTLRISLNETTINHFVLIIMKHYIFLLLFTLIFISFTGCEDDKEELNPYLITGKWELVSSDNPAYTCIYNFTEKGNGYAEGNLSTYYLVSDNNGEAVEQPIQEYCWDTFGPMNNDNIVEIDITPIEAIGTDDPWSVTQRFTVTNLSSKVMTWKRTWPDDGQVLTFIRVTE